MEIKRELYLNQLISRKGNGFVKVITGIRRCGKSYLLNNIFYNHLLESGVDNPFEMTPDIFEGNMRSRSYMPVPGDDTFEACMEELRSVFERFATCGKVTEEVETQIFLGEFTL